MATITRSNHPDALWPGIFGWFGKSYASYPTEWTELFDRERSDKAFEKIAETTGFGLAVAKGEGASISYDSDAEGYLTTIYPTVYGLGYIVTREENEDDLYVEVSKRRVQSLAFSMKQTQEIVHANVFNRGFDTAYPIGDGAAFFSAAHPTRSGNQSNLIAVAADFSETSLESMLIQIAQAKNNRGLQIALTGQKLVVSASDMFNATRILESQLRAGTANNDVNAVKRMGMLPGGVVINHYLTDTDAWFLKTNAPMGLKSLWRRDVEFEQDNDFDTENMKAKSTMRFSPAVTDWRSTYASAGV